MRVKYKIIINSTFYDFLPLYNEMELKGLHFQHEKRKLPLLYLESTGTTLQN